MAVLDVVLYPGEPLLAKASPVQDFGPELAKLAADMIETMHAYEGVGLAAPQVGRSLRMFVLQEPEGEPMCLVNPEILAREGEESAEEGCLSLPRIYFPVARAVSLRVRAQDTAGVSREFEAQGFLARVIQHEFDHLEGRMILDHLDIITRQAVLQEWEVIRKQLAAGVAGKA